MVNFVASSKKSIPAPSNPTGAAQAGMNAGIPAMMPPLLPPIPSRGLKSSRGDSERRGGFRGSEWLYFHFFAIDPFCLFK